LVEAAESNRKLVAPVLTFTRLTLTALATAVVIACSTAQLLPQCQEDRNSGIAFPAPRNLKVLPSNLTGQQVHEIMKQWEVELGVRCDGCHKEDDVKVDAQGKPLLDFADDSKAMKGIARLMYTMTEEINSRYVTRIEGSGLPVTCGTCHRGRVGPEPFTNAPEHPVPVSDTAARGKQAK
jgi:hypothetical protein